VKVCKCRTCLKHYREDKATADWKGFCSQRCMHNKARELGWTPLKARRIGLTEYEVLKRNKQIGSVFVNNLLPTGS